MTLKSGAHSVKATSLLIHSAPTGERGDGVPFAKLVMPGLDPGIHHTSKSFFAKKMDCRGQARQ
jgi:hypothetical protein